MRSANTNNRMVKSSISNEKEKRNKCAVKFRIETVGALV